MDGFPEGVDPAKTVNLVSNRVICQRHGEPFRSQWPKGYLVFGLEGLYYLLNEDKRLFDDAARLKVGDEPVQRGIERALDEKPVCCRLPTDKVMSGYMKSGIGRRGRCEVCKDMSVGTSFKANSRRGVIDFDHVCFHCVLHAFREDHGLRN